MPRRTRSERSYIIEEAHSYNILLDEREIFLHGHSDVHEEDPGVEWRMSNGFVKNMRLLESQASLDNRPIIIHQHSIGGEWADGMMIYDTIKNSTCFIVIIMHGTACSMGSVVPQAADFRVMMPSCEFMLHSGSTDIDESMSYKQAQSWASNERRQENLMLDIYAGVCQHGKKYSGKSETAVRRLIVSSLNKKEDWWLDSRETVEHGFADNVFGDKDCDMESLKKMGM